MNNPPATMTTDEVLAYLTRHAFKIKREELQRYIREKAERQQTADTEPQPTDATAARQPRKTTKPRFYAIRGGKKSALRQQV